MIDLLVFLAATLLASLAAADIYNYIHAWWHAQPPETHGPSDPAFEHILFGRPRITVAVLAVAISLLVSGVLAHASGRPLPFTAERAALAALTTLLVAQSAAQLATFTPDESEDAQE